MYDTLYVTARPLRLAIRSRWARLRVRAMALGRVAAPSLGAARFTPRDSSAPEVNCVVFSKNRAMQLDACLRSIERFAPFSGPISVLYCATTPDFARAYEQLKTGARTALIPQSDDFCRDVMALLDSPHTYVVFQTDDDLFFRLAPFAPLVPSTHAAFSLRLGLNTTFWYGAQAKQAVPLDSTEGDVLDWEWTRADGYFAYPLSLNGHIMRTELVLRALSKARFGNPNELEDELNLRRYLAPSRMAAFKQSCVVTIPANIVTSTHVNRASTDVALSAEALNHRYLSGQRIDIDAMDFSAVRGAHDEVSYVFSNVASED